jgi:formylglycine-generating enzyme required for sulfatase activity/energy-coupling factor transporter ATP-binding protein EcfA2
MSKKRREIQDLNVGRDFIGGDQYVTFITQVGAFTPPPDLAQLRQDYLAHLERSYRALDFKGIPQLRNLARELMLQEVYVPLLARPDLPEDGERWNRRVAGRSLEATAIPEGAMHEMERSVKASAPVSIEEALRDKTRVVVLGDPGSGKSTMLKYLALRLARDNAAPLPILLPLNAYARALRHKELNLQAYLSEYFATRAEGVASLTPLFKEAIEAGRAIILLDGLDEVQENRFALVQKVESFAHDVVQRGNRVLVTSRIVGYRDAPLSTSDWSLYTLLDFTPEAVRTFVEKWCLAFEKSTVGDTPEAVAAAKVEKEGLLAAIEANPGVARLASNPLLLTIVALIKRQGVELPRSRIKLYDRYLETLIEAWNRASALDKTPGRISMDYEATLEVLGPLALRVREENPTAGLVSARQLQDWLTEHYTGEQWGLKPGPAREKAREFLDSVRYYSNLLVERGEGQYGFIHLTFEEALAAYGLVSEGQIDRQRTLTRIQEHLTDPAWRETILLSVGVAGLINRQPLVAGEIARSILKMQCDEKHQGYNILLAGACLEDVGESGLGKVAANEIQNALMEAMQNRSLHPAVQRDAGFSLARTGWVPNDLDEWVPIPAGEFLYGDDKRRMKIEQDFAIQKYPVTNLQFRRFMDDNGYDREELWSRDGWAWRTGTYDTQTTDEDYKRWLANRPPEKRHEPYFWRDPKWNNLLAPVVGVTWFEAEAYANWLTEKLGCETRLPTEYEWERAARGIEGREYAWGNTFDRNKVNCAAFWKQDDNADWAFDMDEAGTSSVVQFKKGNTPDGIRDLSGNVWEWTNSWWDKEQVNRVVRGGSWFDPRRDVRCALRNGGLPDYFLSSIGFRLVSPGSD